MNIRAFKIINAARGRDLQADLRQGGHGGRIVAHEAKSLAIDADQADQGMLMRASSAAYRGRSNDRPPTKCSDKDRRLPGARKAGETPERASA